MTADRSQGSPRAGAIAALAEALRDVGTLYAPSDPEHWARLDAEKLLAVIDAHPEAKAALAAWLVPDVGNLATARAHLATQPATEVPASGASSETAGLREAAKALRLAVTMLYSVNVPPVAIYPVESEMRRIEALLLDTPVAGSASEEAGRR